jgi:hypothetical protein
MPFCTKCGTQIGETDRFCPQCGAARAKGIFPTPANPSASTSLATAHQSEHPVGGDLRLAKIVFLAITGVVLAFTAGDISRRYLYGSSAEESAAGDTIGSHLKPTPVAPSASASDSASSEAVLRVLSWNCSVDESNYIHVRGEVQNLSDASIASVDVVGSLRTDGGTFVKSESALIDYQPILPGQISPFEAIGTGNPAIASADISFQYFLGRTIDFAGPRSMPCVR